MLNNYYWLFDSVLDKDFCNYVVKSTDWNSTELAKVGQEGVNEAKRITKIVWQEIGKPIGCVAQHYVCTANMLAKWNYDLTNFEDVQMSKYMDQGHYDWHMDTFEPQNGTQRKLSCSILLNDPAEFEGGKFEFNIDDSKTIDLKQGSILVFPSFLKHRVTPVTSGTRYSAVIWAYGPTFR